MAETATLYLTQGGQAVVTVALVADTGSAYSIPAGHTFYAFTICSYLGATPKVSKDTATVSGSNVSVTLTSADTNLLSAGKYVGQVVFSLAGSNYVYSDPFVVVVTAKPDFGLPVNIQTLGDDGGVY
jgi:hypothetical protein